MDNYDIALCMAIMEIREFHDLSQRAFAMRAGIHPSIISKVESSKRVPGRTIIGKIASAYNMEVAEIYRKALKIYDELGG